MNSPSFPFYVQDFIYGTRLMTAEQVGGYVRLLCHQWDKGALPDDIRVLKNISGIRYTKTLLEIKEKFELCDDKMLRNKRMEQVRKKQSDYSEHQRARVMKRYQHSDNSSKPAQQLELRPEPATGSAIKKIRLMGVEHDTTASELIWERCTASITELMAGPFSSLKLKDIFAEVDSCSPTGTSFNSEAHLLNKFKLVANAMMKKKASPMPRRQEEPVAVSSRPPIVNL